MTSDRTEEPIIRLLGELYVKDQSVPDWAIKCLEQGYDSKSLRMLASMNDCDSSSEIDVMLGRALRELSWNELSQFDSLLRYSKLIAGDIIENKIDPLVGSRIIYRILIDLDSPSELLPWYDIDEMIWDRDYFLKTGHKSHFFREKDDLVSEIKAASANLIHGGMNSN